jgi:translin
MRTLKTVLNKVKKELIEKDKMREDAYKDMRKATSFSKQAILKVHQKRLEKAEELVEEAGKLLSKLNDVSALHPEIVHGGLFHGALQEYSEANIILELIRKSKLVTPNEIAVPSVDYVLGLADVIGEYRRLTLDALREGNLGKAEKCLKTMDEIYIELMGLDESYVLVPGLRRKCDVARKIIEITRGDVTQEIRRSKLQQHLARFEKCVRKR